MNEFGDTSEVWTVQVDADTTALQTELRAATSLGRQFRTRSSLRSKASPSRGARRRRVEGAGASPFRPVSEVGVQAIGAGLRWGFVRAAFRGARLCERRSISGRDAGALREWRCDPEPDRVSIGCGANGHRRRARGGGDHAAVAWAGWAAWRSAPRGAGHQVTFNVTATDADSFRRSEAQLSAMLARAAALGQRNL